MKKLLFAVVISLCVEIYMYIHICSVYTKVIAKLLPSVLLICLYSLTVSSILSVWTLFRPATWLCLSLVKQRRTGKGRTKTAGKVFGMSAVGVQIGETEIRRCRVGKLSVTFLTHWLGTLTLSTAVVAWYDSTEVRWECCDVLAYAQFLPCGHARTKSISCTSPSSIFFPIPHRISGSNMQQSCEELV